MRNCLQIILILFSLNSFAQNLFYDSHGISYVNSDLNDFITDFNNFDDLPDDIKSKSLKILKNQTGDFSTKMMFRWGNSINLESYFKANPERLNFNNSLIPSYSLHYSFIDSSLGVSRYEVVLWLDSYGQIINLNFPHSYDFQTYDFLPLDKAKLISDMLVILEEFEYDDFDYWLKYDTLRNDLIWDVYYMHNTDYLTFSISTKTHKMIKMKLDTSRIVFPEIDIDYDDFEIEEIKLR